MRPLFGQIVRLTRSILLQPQDRSRRPSLQFFAGKHSPFGFPSIGLAWWYGDDTHESLEAVAALVGKESLDFRDCDPESLTEVALKTLQEICIDGTIFDGDAVVFGRRKTLFDCRRPVPVPLFAEAILNAIEANLRAIICKRCTVYAVPRFQIASFFVPEDSIHAIAKTDQRAWRTLLDAGYQFDGWSPEHPRVGREQDRTFSPPGEFSCVLAAEEYGTQKGARFSSVLKFRKLAAIMFAVACERVPYPYSKAIARPSEFCAQFPHESGSETFLTRSDCGPLVPFYASDIPIGASEVAAIQTWYRTAARCSVESFGRLQKASHFLNRGMNSDDIEAYINYFVTLDALFGQRGSVEASILAGVRSLTIDPIFTQKTPWLFDLRNELVHGGSRHVAEWPRYAKYTQHFRSKPQNDVRALAQLAVLRAPERFTI
jgi:hypothetical protein